MFKDISTFLKNKYFISSIIVFISISFLIIGIFTLPWEFDEGWNLFRIEYRYYMLGKHKTTQKIINNPQEAENLNRERDNFIKAFQTINKHSNNYDLYGDFLFTFSNRLLGLLRLIFSSKRYFIFRIFSLISYLLSFWLTFLILKKLKVPQVPFLIAVAVIVFWSISSMAAISLRPESLIMCLLTLAIYLNIIANEKKSLIMILLSILTALFAFYIHPLGISVCLATLIGIIYFRARYIERVKELLSKRTGKLVFFIFAALLGVLLILTLIIKGAPIITQLYSVIKGLDMNHSIPFYKEYLRYFELLIWSPMTVPFLCAAILFLFLKTDNKNYIYIKLCFVFVLIYLLFLPVKWGHYMNHAVSLIGIIIAYGFRKYQHINRYYILFFISIFSILTSLTIHNADNNELLLRELSLEDNKFLETCLPVSMKNVLKGRINRLEKLEAIRTQLDGKIVYGWPNLYPYFDNLFFINFSSNPKLCGVEYIIYLNELNEEELEKKTELELEYFDFFIFQGKNFNIFKVRVDEKQQI